MSERVSLYINGFQTVLEVELDERLVDSLREKVGLTGTKFGCGVGECGACSVLLDGRLVSSCLVLTTQVDGCRITTIEGLERDGRLDDLQRAFVEEGAVQCGYCTPGMIIAGEALLSRYKRPTTEQIRDVIAGNLCRCTGYSKIVSAIRKTARRRASRRTGR